MLSKFNIDGERYQCEDKVISRRKLLKWLNLKTVNSLTKDDIIMIYELMIESLTEFDIDQKLECACKVFKVLKESDNTSDVNKFVVNVCNSEVQKIKTILIEILKNAKKKTIKGHEMKNIIMTNDTYTSLSKILDETNIIDKKLKEIIKCERNEFDVE